MGVFGQDAKDLWVELRDHDIQRFQAVCPALASLAPSGSIRVLQAVRVDPGLPSILLQEVVWVDPGLFFEVFLKFF